MSQNDLVIDNQSFPATRADINSALQALGSLNSGSSAPSTTYANMLWYDTGSNTLKMRAEANDVWIDVGYLDQSADKFRIFDDTQVVNASGTQTGLIGDQATSAWEAGTSTTESLVSPAKVKAAILNLSTAQDEIDDLATGAVGAPKIADKVLFSSLGFTFTGLNDFSGCFADVTVASSGGAAVTVQVSDDGGASWYSSVTIGGISDGGSMTGRFFLNFSSGTYYFIFPNLNNYFANPTGTVTGSSSSVNAIRFGGVRAVMLQPQGGLAV